MNHVTRLGKKVEGKHTETEGDNRCMQPSDHIHIVEMDSRSSTRGVPEGLVHDGPPVALITTCGGGCPLNRADECGDDNGLLEDAGANGSASENEGRSLGVSACKVTPAGNDFDPDAKWSSEQKEHKSFTE